MAKCVNILPPKGKEISNKMHNIIPPKFTPQIFEEVGRALGKFGYKKNQVKYIFQTLFFQVLHCWI